MSEAPSLYLQLAIYAAPFLGLLALFFLKRLLTEYDKFKNETGKNFALTRQEIKIVESQLTAQNVKLAVLEVQSSSVKTDPKLLQLCDSLLRISQSHETRIRSVEEMKTEIIQLREDLILVRQKKSE